MDKNQKKVYENIIRGFESHYQTVRSQDDMPDNDMTRAAFYNSCLKIVRDGAPLKDSLVQIALVLYYDKQLEEALKKLLA